MHICSVSTEPTGRAAPSGRRMPALVAVLLAAPQVGPVHAFGFDDVVQRAESAARAPYQSFERKPPAELQALTYDQYRDIRFRPEHAVWRSEALPFELMFF